MRIKAVSIYPAEKVMSQNRSKCHLLQSNEQPNSNSACLSLLSLNRSDCYCFFEKVKSVNIVRLLIDLILCLDVYNCSFSMRASFRPSTFVFSSIECWTQASLLGHPWSFMSAYKCMFIHAYSTLVLLPLRHTNSLPARPSLGIEQGLSVWEASVLIAKLYNHV